MTNQAQPYDVDGKVLPEMADTLGDLIQRRMKDVGIESNAELARRTGYSASYIGDLINNSGKTKSGKYLPGPEVVDKLSVQLKTSSIEILKAIGYKIRIDPPGLERIYEVDFSDIKESQIKEIITFIKFIFARDVDSNEEPEYYTIPAERSYIESGKSLDETNNVRLIREKKTDS